MGLVAIFIGISKGHILKVDGAISNFFDPIFWRVNRRFGRQDFIDPLDRGHGNRQHDKDHHKHHERHENGHGVAKHRSQIPSGELATNDQMSPNPRNQKERSIHGKHHSWATQDNDTDSLHKHVINQTRSLLEFNRFICFLNVGLHHPHIGDVFLNAVVEIVISFKYFCEERINNLHDDA